MGLGSGQEEVGFVKQVALRESVLETASVRDQHRIRNAFRPVDPGEDLGRIGKLRDHVGPDERGDLDPPEPGLRQQVDQADLVRSGDHFGLVLETVPGTDLANPD